MSQVLTNRKGITSFVHFCSRLNSSNRRNLHRNNNLERSILVTNVHKFASCTPSLSQTRTQSTSSKIENVQIAPYEGETMNKAVSFFADSPITHVLEDVLISVHDMGSFEWSTLIVLSAFAFRLAVCVPIKVYQERLIARLTNIQPAINEAIESKLKHMRRDSVFLSPQMKIKMIKQMNQIRNQYYDKENCHAEKIPISSLLQFPVWIYLSTSIRNLAFGTGATSLQGEQMFNEKFLWLDSLSMADPTYTLPALFLTIGLLNFKYSLLGNKQKMKISKILNFRKYFSILFLFIMSVVVANLPAAVGLFWLSSNLFNSLELIAFDSSKLRRFFKIQLTQFQPENIYALKLESFLKELFKITRFLKK